jgi:two-component system sensor histidine kinase KdpD
LGLSICKGFVEAHGGQIWAKRGPEGGTTVTFAIPMSRNAERHREIDDERTRATSTCS